MGKLSYAVVSTVSANNTVEVDVVASKWIVDNTFYYYPPPSYKKAQRIRALEKCEDYDEKEWSRFDIEKIYKNNISTY